MNPGVLILPPALVALCALVLRVKSLPVVAAVAGFIEFAASLAVAKPLLSGGGVESFFGWFRLDGMAAWMLVVNSLVYGASMCGASILAKRPEDMHLSVRGVRALFACGSIFIIAAGAVVCAADLGTLWVALEATTVITAPLILLSGTRESIEAAWKYLILCGVGIAFALLGTMFFLAAAGPQGSLDMAWLAAHATEFRKPLLDAGFVFFLLGYGTKAGLFPVHNWLPDAHSEAPAPASALLSGALLNCAMTAVWRIAAIVQRSASSSLLTTLVVPMGAITVLAAAVMLMRQRDLKRMWAYSSIENMGLLTVAAGLQVGSIFVLHALAHSLAKSSAFLLSGNVLKEFGTVNLGKLSGVMRRSPGLGFALLAAGAAVMGAPPFGSFISEWLLLTKVADQARWGVAAALVLGVAISFVAVLIHLGHVSFGERPDGLARSRASLAPAVVLLLLSAGLFVAISPTGLEFLRSALLVGGRP